MKQAAGVLLVLAAAVAVTGGFHTEVAHVRISVQWPTLLSVAAWIMFVAAGAPQTIERYVERRAPLIAAVLAAGTIIVGLGLGALVAAGADPYGYTSQSLLWARGNPVQFLPMLALDAPWPNAAISFCALGYMPAPVTGVLGVPGIIVPIFATGLPLQMSIFARAFGLSGAMLVVPLLGGGAVWAAYRIGLQTSARKSLAVLAALLTACSPVFLYQLMLPMTDVPVTAWWLLSIVAAFEPAWIGALAAGLCASLAILTRPNLLPLVVPVAAYVCFAARLPLRTRAVRVLLFAAGLMPAVVLTGAVNATFFGSPLVFGYGAAGDLFQFANLRANLAWFPARLYSTHSVLPFLGLAAPIVAALGLVGREDRPTLLRHGFLAMSLAATLLLSYVFYRPLDHWTFLRYVLPGIPVLFVMSLAVVDALERAWPAIARGSAIAFVAFVVPLYGVSYAVHGDAFALKALFTDRYVVAADRIRERTPPSAVILGVLQTGSLQLYANRTTMRLDIVPPEWRDRAVAFLSQRGRPTYIAVEPGEAENLASLQGVTIDPLGLVTLYGPLAR